MKHSSQSALRRNATRLLFTLAAICLPVIAASTLTSGFFRTGTFNDGEVANAATAAHSTMNMPSATTNSVLAHQMGALLVGQGEQPNAAISISDSAFNPSSLTIAPGTSVTWTNNGSRRHRVRDTNHQLFDSDDLQPGQSFTYRFNNPGTYNYIDERDDFTGVIIVSGSPGSTPTSAPTGTRGATNTPQRTGTAGPPTNTPQRTATAGATATPGRTSTPAGTAQVNIFDDDGFSPPHITVAIGTTVRWTNYHDDEHTITSPGAFNSGDVRQGQTWSFNFTRPGTYSYFCAYHDEMQGTVTVTCANCTPTPQVTPTVVGGNLDVNIQNFTFQPQDLTVLVGTTIRWTNLDGAPHTSTCDTGQWNSGTLNQGQSFQYTLNTPGTYSYRCDVHPGMRANITVIQQGQNTPTRTNTPQPTNTASATRTQQATATPQATGSGTPPATSTPAPQAVDVSIRVYAYSPRTITVAPGTTVRWTNFDNDQHSVTSLDNPPLFDSGLFGLNGTWQYTFNTPGTYNYYCTLHGTFMSGTVIVEGGASTSTPTSVPTQTSTTTRTRTSTATPQPTHTAEPSQTAQATPTNTPTTATTATSIPTNTPISQVADVNIQNFTYQPQNLTVGVGTTVRWTQMDAIPHTASSNTSVWNSGILLQGQSYQFTFNTPGTYAYHCDLHPAMVGTIVVTNGGNETSTPTHTAQPTNTAVPTNTATVTNTRTATASPSRTVTGTMPPTHTATRTSTATRTNTATITATVTHTAQATNTPAGQAVDVSIRVYAYSPRTITVAPGTTVRWTNFDSDLHSVTSLDNPPFFDSGLFGLNGTWLYTFNTPGTYNYYCTLHGTFMSGTVIVQGSASTSTATAVPTQTSTATVQSTHTAQPSQTAQASSTPQATASHTATTEATATTTESSTATSTNTPTVLPTNTPDPQVADVTIQNFAFQPQNLTVSVGTTVRWTNLDTTPHTSTSDTGAWNSGILLQGQTFQYTFGNVGTYSYYCALHPAMRGTVTVTDGVPATASPTVQATQTSQPSETAVNTPTVITTAQPTNTLVPQIVEVDIVNYVYNPMTVTVPAGTTVHWTNLDTDLHSVTSIDEPRVLDSGEFGLNGTFSYTFNTPGTYNYFCTVHGTFMSGSVIVLAGAPTATPTRDPGQIFSDVTPGDYFYTAVNWLVEQNIVSGYSDGTFRPYNNTTRGQVTKMVVLGEGWEIIAPEVPTFSDVARGDVYYGFVETAVQYGIISGYSDGTFRPGNNVTRGQIAKLVVLARGWNLVDPATASFTDVPVGSPFFNYVETAVQRTIISGYSDGTFRPGNNAVRGQIAKVIFGALNSSR